MNVEIRFSGVWFAALSWVTLASMATGAVEGFEAKSFESKGGGALLYREYVPAGDGADLPLVVFFHGAGERGSDNTAQLKHSVGDILAYSKTSGNAAIIIAPQCPKEKQWVDTPWGDPSHTMPKRPSESMELALELIDAVVKAHSVDKKRIYVTGLSMGGFATWDVIQRRPRFFAAAIPVCGGGDSAQAKKLRKVPIWVTHGDQDKVVLTQRSRDMVASLKAAGGEPRYTELANTKHNAWSPTFSDASILDWLFSQSK